MADIKSGNQSREDLIYALNDAMVKGTFPNITVTESRFDASRGTLYCGDSNKEYSEMIIKEAIDFFESAESLFRTKEGSENYKKAEYCKIALEAIKIMLGTMNNKQ